MATKKKAKKPAKSNMDYANPKKKAAKKAGVVYYPKNSLSFFPENTAIQPDNPHPIAHYQLAACNAQGTLTILGAMPPDFPSRLTSAINGSITLSAERKQNYLQRI